jgi:hypothetical protein
MHIPTALLMTLAALAGALPAGATIVVCADDGRRALSLGARARRGHRDVHLFRQGL